jgi:hypothetical protein
MSAEGCGKNGYQETLLLVTEGGLPESENVLGIARYSFKSVKSFSSQANS